MYSKEVLEHFSNPKNVGEIPDADGVGKVGNIVCGDVIWMYIKVGKQGEREIITDAKFKTLGCAAAIATSSMATVLAIGKTIDEALALTKQHILDAFGGLPPMKVHCSLLAIDALHEAIYDFLKRNNRPISPELEKRHQEAVRTACIAEEKYHEFQKLQEEALSKK